MGELLSDTMNFRMNPEPSNYHTAQTKPRVMIIEDDATLLRMYTEKFTIENFEVLAAKDGEVAYETIKTQTPDCILLDLHIPKLDGLSLIEKLNTEKVSLPPVLALTNIAEVAQRERAKALGIKEYLVKAMFTPEAVVNKVRQYLPNTN